MNASFRSKTLFKIALVVVSAAALAAVAVLSSCAAAPQQTIKIQLPSNAGTGYEWVIDGETPVILQQVGSTTEPQGDAELAGGPLITTYIFQGAEKGDGAISFRLERSWEPADDDLQITYHFTVGEDLHVIYDGADGTYFENERIPTPEVYAQ